MYDAVIIGAGTNGLSLALNLAAAGMRTLVVESERRVGGQASTQQPLLPGFLVHPHANYLSFQDFIGTRTEPACRAMALPPTRTPIAQHGLCFRDGRPPVIIHRRDHRKKTRRSLSRYSAGDARAYEECKARADRLTTTLSRLYFTPPGSASFGKYLAKVSEAFDGIVDPRTLARASARELIDTLFESDEVRTLCYLLATEFSGDLHEPGGAVGLLGYVFWLLGRRSLPLGGMSSVPQALAEAATAAGVRIRTEAAVERVLIEDNAVRGIRLRSGEVVEAPVVASSAGYEVHLNELVGREQLSPAEAAELSRFENTGATLMGSYAAALREAPRYTSAAHDPAIDECAQTFLGLDSTREVLDHLEELRAGHLPAPCGPVRLNTLWDPGQAPAGHHVAGADCAFPDGLDDADLAGVQRSYPAAFLTMWRRYAPNVEDAVLAQRISLAKNVNRKMRLREGTGQYRSRVRGMYFCDSSTHPGGGVHGACGANAFHAIMADRTQ
ncbi:NAD(P)/FAD-dependent oxidoreductase [Amycolatopsis ultiminotia]|uniref:Pyridine nucleotide-disulfide oxidoreductase domain-containing protein 2 n=1 Tax=Amycolatopsis ultiminotia TaxID=543629 RepID=A0ABP6WBG7_9PSEU